MPTTFTFHELAEDDGQASSRGRRFKRQYECVTSELSHEVDVVNAMGVQEGIYLGTPHPRWENAYCDDIHPVRDRDDFLTWIIDLEYIEPEALPGTVPGMPGGGSTGTPPGGGGSPYQQPAPGDRPTYYSLDYRTEPVYRLRDLDGKRLVNSAGDWLEDVPPQYDRVGVLHATNFLPDWTFGLGLLVVGSVNQDTWAGFAPGQLLIDSCPAKPKTSGLWSYWEVNWTLSFKADGWLTTNLIDAGRRQKRLVAQHGGPNVVRFVPCEDAYGQPTNAICLLDGTGQQLNPGDDPVELPFRFRRRVNFTGLIIP